MLWYLPWSENIKKRACRYLLQRYLGNFLEEKLTLDQLSVDLYNGTGTVSDVSLDCEALNELGDSQNWPLEIVDGFMREITVSIPWSTILKDDSVVVVDGLSLTVQPKVRPEPASSMLESMWSSMSSSMQLAEECLRQEDGPPDSNPVEGIEMFAHAIDSILSRVKVKFTNTKIRVEHVPKNSDRGIGMEIHIKNIDYYDEAGSEPTPDCTDPEKSKSYIVSTYINKRIIFDGVQLYTDEFPSKHRTMARSLTMERSTSSQLDKTLETIQSDNFTSAMSDMFDADVTEQTKRELTPDKQNPPEPVLFAKLTGKQELGLKIKHSEDAVGPKVDLQMTLGSLIVFLTPRQLQTLMELVDGLNQPHLEDNSNIPLRSSGAMKCKPMKQADFQLIETQILGNLQRDNNKNNFAMYGWTGQSLEDSDTEFLPMVSQNQMSDSVSTSMSSMSASMTSSVHLPHVQPRVKRNRKVPQIDGDPTAEVSHINIKISSCCCLLLHKDILVPLPLGTDCVTPASAKKLQEVSTEFFSKLGFFSIGGDIKRDVDRANELFDLATERNHLRLITSSLTLDGSEKVTAHGSQTNCHFDMMHLLLRECLYTEGQVPEGFNLIHFEVTEDNSDTDTESVMAAEPCFRMDFKQTLKYVRVGGEKKLLYPTTDITLKCLPFTLDVDLTVLDRVSATVFAQSQPTPQTTAQNQLNVTVHITRADAVLRFPIIDLKPGVSRDHRNVRPDYLLFNFYDVLITSQQSPSYKPLPTTVSIRASKFDLYYYENDQMAGTHLAKANIDDSTDSNQLHSSSSMLPTITLTFQPSKCCKGPFDPLSDDELLDPPPNIMTTSMYIMDKMQDQTPTPFSRKKTAHQSIASHEDGPREKVEELIVPGSEEEMREFTEHCVEQSSIHLDLNIPVLSLQIESKQLYEIIYNRINSDLLLWEPQIVEHFEISPHVTFNTNEPSIYPAFSMCKNTGYDSDTGSSSSDDENLFYSTYDGKNNKKKPTTDSNKKKGTHNFCFTMNVNKGLLTLITPVRDSNKRVVPGQMGELVLNVGKLSMCTVSGLNGVPKTAQLCLRANKTTLYHDAILSSPVEKPPLRLFGATLPDYLKETIAPSAKGVLLKEDINHKDMLTLALNVEPEMDLPNFKKICMALGIERATLRHRGDAGIAWLLQLLDELDVVDYPVPGYKPSIVLTELHAHIWNCAIDYRPLYLPIRSIVTLGSFSISSNVIAQSNSTSLRLLAQECALFLRLINVKGKVPQDEGRSANLNDYVCVCDVGLFELSLRMADKTSGGPHIDLCASNNMLSLRTCWDSASALCRLLTYLASDKDSAPEQNEPQQQLSEEPNEELLLGLDDHPEEIRDKISPSELQQVNDMMEEAMQESPDSTLNNETSNPLEKEGVEIFFFPDESTSPKNKPKETIDAERDGDIDDQKESVPVENKDEIIDNQLEFHDSFSNIDMGEEAKPSAQVIMDLGDPSVTIESKPKRTQKRSSGESNTDDEFCIVENPHQSDNSEPSVRWLGVAPKLMDDHFALPAKRTHVLAPPKAFPVPKLRYTLCEMSVTWYMYGGHDFISQNDPTNVHKKNVSINDNAKLSSSPTSPKCKIEYEPYDNRRVKVSYRASSTTRRGSRTEKDSRHSFSRGGPNRDLNTGVQICLTKVKFQHETYHPGETQSSRQTLAISKIEVLDRLSNSHINKLLSQYQVADEPERKNAHMLVIKAVHLRPDAAVSAQECCLKVSLLPLRFNIDQDTLAFLIGFFSRLGSDECPDDDERSLSGVSIESTSSRQSTPTHRPPVMSVTRSPSESNSNNDTVSHDGDPLMESYEAERLVSENLIQLEDEFQLRNERSQSENRTSPDNDDTDDSPVYFRRVVFSPEVPIRLDYVGKRVDLSAGPIAGLLMGLGQLNCSELRLKRLYHRQGVLGVERLIKWALNEWLMDIKRHQLPGLLSGIGPMHSLLQFVRGIRDLVWLPVEQWRRDGRVVHGLRRGAASFTARTAVAALDITNRLLHVIQATAETAFDMLTPGPTVQLQEAYDRRERRRRRRQDPARNPADIREGVANAYQTVKEGFAETASTMQLAARSGHTVGVLRHLPGAALSPLAVAAAGAADLLGGVRAHLAPDDNKDMADKWRPRPDSPTTE